MSSSVLLLLDNATEQDVLPGKLGDYLGAARPILAFPNSRGELARILEQTGTGLALSRVEDIAKQLRQWYQQWKSGDILAGTRDEARIAPFSRRFGAKQLAGILDELTSGPGSRRAS